MLEIRDGLAYGRLGQVQAFCRPAEAAGLDDRVKTPNLVTFDLHFPIVAPYGCACLQADAVCDSSQFCTHSGAAFDAWASLSESLIALSMATHGLPANGALRWFQRPPPPL